MAARTAEATSVAATASAFYRSEMAQYCKSQFLDSEQRCGGHAVLRKFRLATIPLHSDYHLIIV
ncbi:hypothetical protein C8F04DRAFT_1252128 [Mycena alexandri]|uniref:Uncharacterized protein n=1 Tax=Mycena alexandri TaxID=1745969 RepID=A0AAD6XEB7_9AGAR|nr:hypothetical protein C8F04DRAFT_1252128 [Mycena alexandri]